MSELQHGNKTEPDRAVAELDEGAARYLGCTALTGHEADEAVAPVVAEEQNRDTSVDQGVGLADPQETGMAKKRPFAVNEKERLKIVALALESLEMQTQNDQPASRQSTPKSVSRLATASRRRSVAGSRFGS